MGTLLITQVDAVKGALGEKDVEYRSDLAVDWKAGGVFSAISLTFFVNGWCRH